LIVDGEMRRHLDGTERVRRLHAVLQLLVRLTLVRGREDRRPSQEEYAARNSGQWWSGGQSCGFSCAVQHFEYHSSPTPPLISVQPFHSMLAKDSQALLVAYTLSAVPHS